MSEKSDSFKNRGVLKISVFITSIFVIFLSVTYAFINQTLTGERRQVITTGSLSVELVEDNEIGITGAMPMYDEVGMLQKSFDFRIINHGTEKVNYILKLVDITTGDSSNKLDPSIVKYGLTKDGKNTIKYVSNIIGNSLDKGTINGNETIIEYSLRLWIDSGVVNETLIKDKVLKFKIDIEVEQVQQKSEYAMMRSRTNSSSTDYFWKYSSQITSVVFEPTINIPEGVESWDVSNRNSGQVMAYVEEDGKCIVNSVEMTAYKLHIQAQDGVVASSGYSLFYGFSNLIAIDGLEYFDTSKVADMGSMFEGCNNLVDLDLKDFDTSNVENMEHMFSECSSLTNLNVSTFNVSKVTIMLEMFWGCSSLTSLDLSHFITSNLKTIYGMFGGCSKLTTLNLSNFDTSRVTDMSGVFWECNNLTSLDISNFDMSKVTTTNVMFYSVPTNALITVRDEITKTLVLGVRSDLTNVQVKSA